jgi:putative aminopeptidase FrvX
MGLRELTELCGVSGAEQQVRAAITQLAQPLCDELLTDSLGNLIAVKGAHKPGPRVMLAAHMDEVGFIICGFHDSGLLQFKTVGGIDNKVLLGKHVWVGDQKLPGVIGSKPIHLLKSEERKRVPSVDQLFIDIGAADKKSAAAQVALGDYATFATNYCEFGAGLAKAKALDDRVGCQVLLDILALELPFPLYAAFTVQEELGLRGAQVAAYRIDPQLALVLEGTTCADVPDSLEHKESTLLGSGPAISIMDRTSIAHKPLREYLMATAQTHGIPYQVKRVVAGGNDAGVIHLSRGGVPTATISVPCRYIHSPASVASLSDIAATTELVTAALQDLPERGETLWSI